MHAAHRRRLILSTAFACVAGLFIAVAIIFARIPSPALAVPLPTVSVTADPTTIPVGATTTISWTSTNATACVTSGNLGTNSVGISGSVVVQPPVVGTWVYSVTCTGAGGSATAGFASSSTPPSSLLPNNVCPSSGCVTPPALPAPAPPLPISTSTPVTLDAATYQAAIVQILAANSLTNAAIIAKEAGLTVATTSDPQEGVANLTVTDPGDGIALAHLTEYYDRIGTATTSTASLPTPAFSFVEEGLDAVSHLSFNDLFHLPVSTAYGQSTGGSIAVGNTTGQMASCSIAGSNGAANIFVNADGSIFGVTGPFNFNFNVTGSDSTSNNTMSGYANAALSTILSASSLPIMANSTNNQVTAVADFSVADTQALNPDFNPDGNDGGVIGVSIYGTGKNSDGSTETSCFADVLVPAAASVGLTPIGYQNAFAHELSHCFGLAHTTDPHNLMYGPSAGGSDADSILNSDLQNTTPLGFNAAQTQYLKDLAAGNQISVENCQAACDSGEGYVVSEGGACEPLQSLCPVPPNPQGSFWDDADQSCDYCSDPNATYVPSLGACVDTRCTNNGTNSNNPAGIGTDCTGTNPFSCPGSETIQASGQCGCDPGYTMNADGSCTEASSTICDPSDPTCANPPPNSCPDGYSLAPDGSCQETGSGNCVDPDTGESASCADVCASQDPEPDWCASVAGTASFCAQNPDDPACSNSDNGCSADDPSCSGSGSSDYCSLYPSDPECLGLCASDPTDPSCIGNTGNGDGGDGGSGGGCGIYDDGSIDCYD